jgi:hypothetical protein
MGQRLGAYMPANPTRALAPAKQNIWRDRACKIADASADSCLTGLPSLPPERRPTWHDQHQTGNPRKKIWQSRKRRVRSGTCVLAARSGTCLLPFGGAVPNTTAKCCVPLAQRKLQHMQPRRAKNAPPAMRCGHARAPPPPARCKAFAGAARKQCQGNRAWHRAFGLCLAWGLFVLPTQPRILKNRPLQQRRGKRSRCRGGYEDAVSSPVRRGLEYLPSTQRRAHAGRGTSLSPGAVPTNRNSNHNCFLGSKVPASTPLQPHTTLCIFALAAQAWRCKFILSARPPRVKPLFDPK